MVNKFKLKKLQEFKKEMRTSEYKGIVKYKVKGSWQDNMLINIETNDIKIGDYNKVLW